MKYLFFDIECASVLKNRAKICAFGYCLTDEQFHILEKEDILINPQGGFHLTDRKGAQGLVLPYKYDEFKNYPAFREVAPRIYDMLEDKDTLVGGHATMNDVKYLNLETDRFKLRSFDFRFIDTQFIYMNRIGTFNRQFGLGAIAESLGVEFTPHRAVDDAFATMKIAEAMCKAEGCDLPALLARYEITPGHIADYQVEQNSSAAYRKYIEEAQAAKEKREAAKVHFHTFVDSERKYRPKKGGRLQNVGVCFSHPLEIAIETSEPLLKKAYAAGALYAYRIEDAAYYIVIDGETGVRVNAAAAQGKKILTVAEFSALLGD